MSRILLDENLPVQLKKELIGHEVRSVAEMKWSGIDNGVLLRRMEGAFDILRRAGLSGQDAVQAFRAFGGYIMGFVLMETGNLYAAGGIDAPDPEQLAQVLPADELPRIIELMPYLSSGDADEDFEFGLDLLLAGLRDRLAN